jgi:excisionase family DNA binding protein
MSKILFTLSEAAEQLSISRASVEALVKSNQCPVVKIGRSVRIHVDALNALARKGTANRTTHGQQLHALWQKKDAA